MTEQKKETYELKKNIVLSSLQSLRGHWYLAESLFENIQTEGDNPELIEAIIEMFEIAIESVKDESNKEKLRGTLASLSALKQKEISEMASEKEEAGNIIENFNL